MARAPLRRDAYNVEKNLCKRAFGLFICLSALHSHCSTDILSLREFRYSQTDDVPKLEIPDGTVENTGSVSHTLSCVLQKQVTFNFSFSCHVYIAQSVKAIAVGISAKTVIITQHGRSNVHADPNVSLFFQDLAAQSGSTADIQDVSRLAFRQIQQFQRTVSHFGLNGRNTRTGHNS